MTTWRLSVTRSNESEGRLGLSASEGTCSLERPQSREQGDSTISLKNKPQIRKPNNQHESIILRDSPEGRIEFGKQRAMPARGPSISLPCGVHYSGPTSILSPVHLNTSLSLNLRSYIASERPFQLCRSVSADDCEGRMQMSRCIRTSILLESATEQPQ